jgi:tRNA(fMet)-specific endonuclease VapC
LTGLRFLLDTNILSEPLRPRPNANVMQHLKDNAGSVATTAVVWHEILFGYHRMVRSSKREILEAYLWDEVRAKMPLLPYDAAAAEWFAQERARLSAIGKTPAYADGQIAAVAQVNNLIMVTNNVKDYAEFQDLRLENWFS